jgi:multidrug efflux pump subunit AcrA (membrane-fusion protein)
LTAGGVLALLAVLAAVLAARALWPAAPGRQLAVSGRLEGYQSDLGAKVGGRVAWIAVREGAVVRTGQVLVQLDDAQARAQSAAAVAAVAAAEDRARQSQATLAVLASQIRETTLGGSRFRISTVALAAPLDRSPTALLDAGNVRAAIVIPPGTQRAVAAGRVAAIQSLVDAADVVNALTIKQILTATAASISRSCPASYLRARGSR